MPKRILWLDNDPAYTEPYVETLLAEGFDVTRASTVFEAESLIESNGYNLVIIDVMIPTSEEEEEAYGDQETDFGSQTGLLFYRRMKSRLEQLSTRTLVVTVRWDQGIADEFAKAGLPRQQCVTKYNMRDVDVFLTRVRSLLM